MKNCIKCGVEKPLTGFYRKSGARLSSKCKECTKAQVKAHRALNLDYYRQIDRRRSMLPHRVMAREQWEANHPDRAEARRTVQNSVKAGRLQRLPCAICGEAAEAHHPDYSAPLDVVWLCRFHHKQAHALARKAA